MLGSPLHKTLDFQQTFPSFHPAYPGTCRIRIYESGRSDAEASPVVVASQNSDSAASITNFAEDIATAIIRSHRERFDSRSRHFCEPAAAEPPRSAVWIEHYPPGTMLTSSQERFSIVTFQPLPHGTFASPQWQTVPRTLIEHLLLRAALGD